MAKEVLHQLEMAHGHWPLAAHKDDVHCTMKIKSLGLSSLQRAIAMQESCIIWLSEGNTLTKFFHVHTAVRSRSKYICTLEHDGCILVHKAGKAEEASDFFNDILGILAPRKHAINLDVLDLPRLELAELGERFTEAEILAVIKLLPLDKALGRTASQPDF
jgi:hypothetical protein